MENQSAPSGARWRRRDLLRASLIGGSALADVPKKLVEFTVADGAEYHCAPMAPQRRNQVVFDWLEGIL